MLVSQLRIPAPNQAIDALGHAPLAATASLDGGASSGQPGEPHAPPYRPEEPFVATRPRLEFSDLESLESTALAQILHRCSANTTLLALAGASHQFVQQIMSQLPGREAAQLERKIQQIGPLRLDDVQRAQAQVADIAQRLIDEGSLTIPGQHRLSVAA